MPEFSVAIPVLQRDLVSFSIGALACSVAAVALAYYFVRKLKSDQTLLWFGIFGILYGMRLMCESGTFLAALGISGRAGQTATALITFIIQVPASEYALRVIDVRKTRLAKAILAVAAALAATGIVVLALGRGIPTLFTVNNILVLAFVLPVYIYLYSRATLHGVAVMKVGFTIFILTVIADNVGGVLPALSVRLEPFGFLVMLIGMGIVTARRTLDDQERLRTVNRELEIARSIQLSILPEKLPEVPGLEVAARYQPMTEVAGDFYDFIELGDGKLGVLVADVSGHGVPAALIASMLKMAFVSCGEHADDPARVLKTLNTLLCGRFKAHFVTAAYVFLDVKSGEVRYSGAAHPSLLVKRADGTTEQLQENGLMLGAFDFANYSNASARLGAGDELLLVTDGLVEGSGAAKEDFGEARILAAFDGNAQGTIAKLFGDFESWTRGAAQQDDLTAVSIRRK